MRRMMISKRLPHNLGNRPGDTFALDAMQEIMTERLRSAAADQINVQHQHFTASIVTGTGDRSTLVSTAYIVEPDDLHHLHALVRAVESDDTDAIVKAARDFAAYLNTNRDDGEPNLPGSITS